MKFAEHLSAHITPEWRKQYIQYEEMKAMLYAAMEQAPSPEESEESVLQRYFAKFDEKFFLFSEKELAKINTFFSEKLAEATRKFANLKNELYSLNEENESALSKSMARLRKGKLFIRDQETKMAVSRNRKIQDLKVAFSEFYLSLILLQNYQTLNFTGFRKIIKKHDKLLETDRGAVWKQTNVDTSHFHTNKDIDRLIQQTEALFTQELESGNRQKAMKRLRVPPLNDQQSPWTTFRVGLFAGIFCVLSVTIILTGVFSEIKEDWRPAVRLFRGTFLIILDTFLIAINVYGWRSAGVNHVLIFELDPRNHLSHQHLMELAGIFAVLWGLCVLLYLYSFRLNVPPYISPLALVCIMMLFLFNPTRTMQHDARFWLLKILWHIVTAPFHYVGFADFWLADQLNSVVLVLLDLQYLVCFYAFEVNWLPTPRNDICMSSSYGVRPLVASLPAWFRFAQCLRRYRDTKKAYPHLVNAGKYSTTFFVVLFSALHSVQTESSKEPHTSNPYFYLWIVSAVISSCYTYTWDVRMDWGLFEQNAGENKFLREEIVYSSKGYYYFAIVEDFILRFAWTLSVSVGEGKYLEMDILLSVLGPLEVFRRFVWNFYRLENEHLNNCGQFRAVRDISVAPKDSSDQDVLEKMMDEEDGVTNRRKDRRKPAKSKHKETKVWIEPEDDDLDEIDPRTSRYGGGV